MKLFYFFLLTVFLLIFVTSCKLFRNFGDTKIVYIVVSSTANVKDSVKHDAEIIGQVCKGDTIYPIHTHMNSVSFDYNGKKGWVDFSELEKCRIQGKSKVSNMQLSETGNLIADYLKKYGNWKTWIFWVIAAGSIAVVAILIVIGKALENYLYYWCTVEDFAYSKLPHFAAIIGALFSVVYMFWYETVLKAIFVTKFWWMPSGNSWIDWYLWSASLLGILGLLFFWIKHLYHYHIRGLIVIFYYTLTAIVAFVAGLYLGIAVLIIAIVLLVIYVGSSLLEGIGNSIGTEWKGTSKKDQLRKEEEYRIGQRQEKEFWERHNSSKDD